MSYKNNTYFFITYFAYKNSQFAYKNSQFAYKNSQLESLKH